MCVCDGSVPINDLSASQPECPPDDLPPLCGSSDKHSNDAVAIAIDSPVSSSPLLFFSACLYVCNMRPVSPRRHGIPAAPAHPGVIKS